MFSRVCALVCVGFLTLSVPIAADPIYQFVSNNSTYQYSVISIPTAYGVSTGDVASTTPYPGKAPAAQLSWGYDPTQYPGYVDTGTVNANELYIDGQAGGGMLPYSYGNQYTVYHSFDLASPSITFSLPNAAQLTLTGQASVSGADGTSLIGGSQPAVAVFDPGTYTYFATNPASATFSTLTFAPAASTTPEPAGLVLATLLTPCILRRRRRQRLSTDYRYV